MTKIRGPGAAEASRIAKERARRRLEAKLHAPDKEELAEKSVDEQALKDQSDLSTPAIIAHPKPFPDGSYNNRIHKKPEHLVNRIYCWERAIAGWSPLQISEESERIVGRHLTTSKVRMYIDSHLLELGPQRQAEEYRKVASARLDHYLSKLEDRIKVGDDKAINAAVRIEERRAKMLGYDTPVKLEVGGSAQVDPELLEMVRLAKKRQLEIEANTEDAEVVDETPPEQEDPEVVEENYSTSQADEEEVEAVSLTMGGQIL